MGHPNQRGRRFVVNVYTSSALEQIIRRKRIAEMTADEYKAAIAQVRLKLGGNQKKKSKKAG
jgi:hypothetical protein